MRTPMVSSEREPLSDVSITDKEVKVVIEMPGVPKDKKSNLVHIRIT